MTEKMQLGKNGPEIARIGYGAMVLEGYYGTSDDEHGCKTLQHAIAAGIMIDSADAYGNGHNEILIGRAIRQSPGKAFVATKFGIVFDEKENSTKVPTGWGFSLNINGTPRYAAKALEASLKRLECETIDLWYAHFPDPATPIEETVGAMAEAVRAGKVRYLGLSNVSADQVRRAHAVHPISAVQFEYSLWRREAELELLPVLRELGIGLVGWSPLGSGFLTGTVERLADQDFRNNNPRYSAENLKSNADRFAPLLDIAKQLCITPAQLALAWLLHQGSDIFPIPGTRSIRHLNENLEAADIELTAATLEQLDEIAPIGITKGAPLI